MFKESLKSEPNEHIEECESVAVNNYYPRDHEYGVAFNTAMLDPISSAAIALDTTASSYPLQISSSSSLSSQFSSNGGGVAGDNGDGIYSTYDFANVSSASSSASTLCYNPIITESIMMSAPVTTTTTTVYYSEDMAVASSVIGHEWMQLPSFSSTFLN